MSILNCPAFLTPLTGSVNVASSSWTGSAVAIRRIQNLSIQYDVIAPATGTFQVQVSNDVANYGASQATAIQPTNWNNYSGSWHSLSGSATSFVNLPDLTAGWVRLVWTPTVTQSVSASITTLSNNSGSVQAMLFGKGWT